MRLPLWRTKWARRNETTEEETPDPTTSPATSEADHSEAEKALREQQKKLREAVQEKKDVQKKVGWIRRERAKNHFGPGIIDLYVTRGRSDE